MAMTVNKAFHNFMQNVIDLDSEQVRKARKSRDNLISNINSFSDDDDFFSIYSDRNLRFGSFERHTKLKPLDDIDLMICIVGGDERYYAIHDKGEFIIKADKTDIANGLYSSGDSGLMELNSTKVINRFISKLSKLNDYNKAEMHKNHEAATLKLKSYDWNFDIVPCFYCDKDFYLIPNGHGRWKQTDPRIDNRRTTNVNKMVNGNLLPLIRLVKYWNQHNNTYTLGSYLLECMILDKYYFENNCDGWIAPVQFAKIVKYLSLEICNKVYDPKGIQGDLNNFNHDERIKISKYYNNIYYKAKNAIVHERWGNQDKAIALWKEILGSEFPDYMVG